MTKAKCQYPFFLGQLAQNIASIAKNVNENAQYVVERPECIADRPHGSKDYRHVCSFPDGTTITIRRFNHSDGSKAGHQLEICRNGTGTRIRVPKSKPIHFPDSDDEVLSLALELAPYVLAVLAGVSESGEINAGRGLTDF